MASSDAVKAKIASLGMSLLQPATGLAALERLLAAPALAGRSATMQPLLPMPAHSSVDVVPFKWGRMAQRYQPLPQFFGDVVEGAAASSTTHKEAVGAPAGVCRGSRLQQQQLPSPTPAVTQEKLLTAVKAAVQDVLGREVSTLQMCVHAAIGVSLSTCVHLGQNICHRHCSCYVTLLHSQP